MAECALFGHYLVVADSGLDALLAVFDEFDDGFDGVSLSTVGFELKSRCLVLRVHLHSDSAIHSVWNIRCDDVVENSLSLQADNNLFILDADHPLLLEHTTRQASILFSGAAFDPIRPVGALTIAHQRVVGGWRPLSRYLRPDAEWALRNPSGQLGDGPVPLLDAYAEALEPLGVHCRLLSQRPARHRDVITGKWFDTDPEVQVLLLSGPEPGYVCERDASHSFVVARTFHVDRQSADL
jgi:hypothetical protein